MRRILAFLVFGLLLFHGCTQSKPAPQANATNQSNYTAPPALPSNVTGNSTVPPGYEVKDYCVQDSDCVRQQECCDCGLGEYVNIYNVEAPVCTPPQCACPMMRSSGACQGNRCVAVPYNESGDIFFFRSNASGGCGYGEILPTKTITKRGTNLSGSIQTPNPCYAVEANLTSGINGTYVIRITTKPLVTFAACVQCTGDVPWFADIMGYNGSIEVYYGDRKVYSDIDRFCGWSSGKCGQDSDCVSSGCFHEVCQSRGDPPTVTNCDDNRDCYNQGAYGVYCGCASGRCGWKRQ